MWKPALLLSVSALLVMTVPALLLTVVFADSDVDSITGTVRYLDGDVDLPVGACVEVVLVDVSDEDSLAIALGRQVIEGANTLPVEFNVTYRSDRLTPGAAHELWVAVRHEGELLYTTASDIELERSASDIEVSVTPPLAMP
ncbi:MAG: YbaY family lipoprotein [Chloroflexota bacterium]|nr:YbaY family lipoprotein [Chloroflexota bacterium]